jgi:hypothetical protein
MSRVEIDYTGEGRSDDAIARKLIEAANGVPGTAYTDRRAARGKSSMEGQLLRLNARASYGRPVLALRDLDQDAPCPGALVARILPDRNPRLLLRICVREIETWLMADSAAYAKFCGVKESRIPRNLEAIPDPKRLILNWVDSGEAAKLKRHVDEKRKIGVPFGALLGEWHAEFAANHWDPIKAAKSGRSASLSNALTRLRELVKHEA